MFLPWCGVGSVQIEPIDIRTKIRSSLDLTVNSVGNGMHAARIRHLVFASFPAHVLCDYCGFGI